MPVRGLDNRIHGLSLGSNIQRKQTLQTRIVHRVPHICCSGSRRQHLECFSAEDLRQRRFGRHRQEVICERAFISMQPVQNGTISVKSGPTQRECSVVLVPVRREKHNPVRCESLDKFDELVVVPRGLDCQGSQIMQSDFLHHVLNSETWRLRIDCLVEQQPGFGSLGRIGIARTVL